MYFALYLLSLRLSLGDVHGSYSSNNKQVGLTRTNLYVIITRILQKGLLFPARESLVSDIPAGDWKIANLFLTVYLQLWPTNERELSSDKSHSAINECSYCYTQRNGTAYIVKKRFRFSRSLSRCDIPAGDGKITKFFTV
jgi:hypothetical protein